MEYKTYEYPSFNLHTVKTNRFKTVQMEIIFRDEVKCDDLLTKTFLVDLMTDVSEKYKTRKEMLISKRVHAFILQILIKIQNFFSLL